MFCSVVFVVVLCCVGECVGLCRRVFEVMLWWGVCGVVLWNCKGYIRD